jgi:hypothetical protein
MILDTSAGIVIIDLDDTHGIWRGNERVTHCLLRHGELIRVGDSHLELATAAGTTAPTIFDDEVPAVARPGTTAKTLIDDEEPIPATHPSGPGPAFAGAVDPTGPTFAPADAPVAQTARPVQPIVPAPKTAPAAPVAPAPIARPAQPIAPAPIVRPLQPIAPVPTQIAAAVVPPLPTFACSLCGALMEAGDAYCDQCGAAQGRFPREAEGEGFRAWPWLLVGVVILGGAAAAYFFRDELPFDLRSADDE